MHVSGGKKPVHSTTDKGGFAADSDDSDSDVASGAGPPGQPEGGASQASSSFAGSMADGLSDAGSAMDSSAVDGHIPREEELAANLRCVLRHCMQAQHLISAVKVTLVLLCRRIHSSVVWGWRFLMTQSSSACQSGWQYCLW